MKSITGKPNYRDLIRQQDETKQTLSLLRKLIVNPDLSYSEVAKLSDRIHNLSKFYISITKLVDKIEAS
jgi:hypothetical protein